MLRTQTGAEVQDVPDDLLLFQARMRQAGVRVRLPVHDPHYQQPAPVAMTVNGEQPHEVVIRLRGGK